MFRHLTKLFRHDGMGSANPLSPEKGKVHSARARSGAKRDERGGRVPLSVGESRFMRPGMFEGTRQWQ